MSAHTPGPWVWINSDSDEPYDFSVQWDGSGMPSLRTAELFGENKTVPYGDGTRTTFALPKWILDCEPFPNESDVNAANARLIAAAPELLEIVARLMRVVEAGIPDLEDVDCYQMAKELLAKIDGGAA